MGRARARPGSLRGSFLLVPRRGPGERRAGRQTLRRRQRRRLTGARGRRAEEQPASGGGAGATTRWPGCGGGSALTARAQSAPAGDGPAGTRETRRGSHGSATGWRRRDGGGRGNLLKRRSGSRRPLLPAAMGGSTGRESRVGPWVCASAWSVRTSGQGARLRSGDANVSL